MDGAVDPIPQLVGLGVSERALVGTEDEAHEQVLLRRRHPQPSDGDRWQLGVRGLGEHGHLLHKVGLAPELVADPVAYVLGGIISIDGDAEISSDGR